METETLYSFTSQQRPGVMLTELKLSKRIDDPSQIQEAGIRYFSNLYKSPPASLEDSIFKIYGPKLSGDQNSFLLALPTNEEVKDVVFSLK